MAFVSKPINEARRLFASCIIMTSSKDWVALVLVVFLCSVASVVGYLRRLSSTHEAQRCNRYYCVVHYLYVWTLCMDLPPHLKAHGAASS